MVKCPDGECHQQSKDVHTEMFKKDGIKDRMRCVERKKIPWTALTWLVPISLTAFIFIGGLIYNSYAESQKKQDEAHKQQEMRHDKLKDKFDKDHDLLVATVTELQKNNKNMTAMIERMDKLLEKKENK
jgi:uncharacterized protein YlxW (UPF0749 family)